jgi:hypothetical protein
MQFNQFVLVFGALVAVLRQGLRRGRAWTIATQWNCWLELGTAAGLL